MCKEGRVADEEHCCFFFVCVKEKMEEADALVLHDVVAIKTVRCS